MSEKLISREELIAFLHECEPEYMAASEDEKLFMRLEKGIPSTRLYVGCDSERFKVKGVWHADFTRVVVVHVNGNKGCRIFGETVRAQDFDARKDKPRLRLMTEAYKLVEMYLRFADILENFDTEVHLDLNPKIIHNSSIVVDEAIGYIRGMINVVPMIKPNAFAASYAADRYKEIINFPKAADSK